VPQDTNGLLSQTPKNQLKIDFFPENLKKVFPPNDVTIALSKCHLFEYKNNSFSFRQVYCRYLPLLYNKTTCFV
jgi:hypothetical protein